MTIEERTQRLEATVYGNGKRGILERIGRLEILLLTVGTLIVTLQISILVKLFIENS